MADLSSLLAGTEDFQTPEEIERRRRQGTQWLNQGSSVAPVAHWTQAAARGLQGAFGGFELGQARDQEQRGKAAANAALVDALTGKKSPTDIATTALRNPWSQEFGQKLAGSAIQSQMQQNTPQAQMALKLQEAQIRNLDRREEPDIVRTLRAAGIDPKSPEGQQAIMGTVKHRPESALDKKVANETAEIAVKYIQSGDAASDMMGAVKELKQIAQDPKLVSAIGPVMGDSRYQSTIGRLPLASGNPELNARINRLQQALALGGTQAFLKGLGSASDAEGRRVEQAVSNLTTSRDAQEFNSNLRIIEAGLQRTLARANAAKQRFPQLDVAGYGQPQVPGAAVQTGATADPVAPRPGRRQFNDLPRADQRTALTRLAKDTSPETLKNFEEEFGSEALGRALEAIKKLKSGTAF